MYSVCNYVYMIMHDSNTPVYVWLVDAIIGHKHEIPASYKGLASFKLN